MCVYEGKVFSLLLCFRITSQDSELNFSRTRWKQEDLVLLRFCRALHCWWPSSLGNHYSAPGTSYLVKMGFKDIINWHMQWPGLHNIWHWNWPLLHLCALEWNWELNLAGPGFRGSVALSPACSDHCDLLSYWFTKKRASLMVFRFFELHWSGLFCSSRDYLDINIALLH